MPENFDKKRRRITEALPEALGTAQSSSIAILSLVKFGGWTQLVRLALIALVVATCVVISVLSLVNALRQATADNGDSAGENSA